MARRKWDFIQFPKRQSLRCPDLYARAIGDAMTILYGNLVRADEAAVHVFLNRFFSHRIASGPASQARFPRKETVQLFATYDYHADRF